jgi:hypothetical protein
MSSDPFCQMHAADYPTVETVKVSDGGLENVIVFVSGGLPAGTNWGTPSNPIEINQENCHYIPHVFTMQTNQPLKVKNSDMTLHNIHVWAEKNPQFNVGQPLKGRSMRRSSLLRRFHCRSNATFTSGWARSSVSLIIRSVPSPKAEDPTN